MNKVNDYPQLLRTLELIPDGVALVDESGKIVFANLRLLAMFDYTRKDLLGNSIEILLPEKYLNLREGYYASPYTREMSTSTDILGQTRKGRIINLDIMISPVDTDKGTYILAAIRDVSHYKEMAKALLQSRKKLEKKVKELNTFFYNTSHTLKGPISTALGLVNLGMIESKEKITQTYFKYISDTLTGLEVLFDKISFLTKLEGSRLNITAVDFEKTIEGVCQRLTHVQGFEHVSITVTNKMAGPFYSDVEVLEGLFYHVLENSVKYRHFRRQKTLISVNIYARRNNAYIEVSDNGIGIPKAIQGKVFNMFFRGSERSEGSGMGLYIVKRSVKRLNGKVKIASKPKVGTRIKITLSNLPKNYR